MHPCASFPPRSKLNPKTRVEILTALGMNKLPISQDEAQTLKMKKRTLNDENQILAKKGNIEKERTDLLQSQLENSLKRITTLQVDNDALVVEHEQQQTLVITIQTFSLLPYNMLKALSYVRL
jgi:hypothetical protein